MNDQPCNETAAWTCRRTAFRRDIAPAFSRRSEPLHLIRGRNPSRHSGTVIRARCGRTLPTHQDLPVTTELAVLFVDLADSTRMMVRQPPTQALHLIQRFTEIVTDIAVAHCGDVKDYEGDGALPLFCVGSARHPCGVSHADGTRHIANERQHVVRARFSLNVGEVTIGVIGSALRRSVALIGPTVNLAARLLKHLAPGGIIAPQTVVERLQPDAPPWRAHFRLQGTCLTVRDFEGQCVTAYSLPPTSLEASVPSLMVGDPKTTSARTAPESRNTRGQQKSLSSQRHTHFFPRRRIPWTVSFTGPRPVASKMPAVFTTLPSLLQHPHHEVHVPRHPDQRQCGPE